MTVGIGYPLSIDTGGGLSLSTGHRLTDEHVLSIIETIPGERVMRRTFGLPNSIFKSLKPALVDLTVEKSIREGSPTDLAGVIVSGDFSEIDQGVYRIQIEYGDQSLNLELSE